MSDLKTKQRVSKRLEKWGYSDPMIEQMMQSNYDAAIKMYPDAKPAKIADIVSILPIYKR